MINFTPRFIKKNVEKIIYETAFDYMTSKVITFKADQGIIEVIETITKRKISGAPVINDNGEIIGIITEKDCLRLIYDEKYHNLPPNKGNVINYMSKKVVTVDYKTRIDELANMFMNSNFRRYPVLKDGKMVGIISRRDVLKACRKIKKTTWDLQKLT
jgi:CBS domain-containing protein|tara:strand:- start:136 stop:609 length:474 start_codon:yes stop_codon:yes gene_type:complete